MIKDLRFYEAITCNEEDLIVDVANLIKEKGIRHIFVVNDENQPVGIISTMDINNKVVANSGKLNGSLTLSKIKAREVMNFPVDAVDINQEVEFAMRIMMQRRTYSCLVTEKGKVKGVVDYKSVMERITKKLHQD